MAIASKFKSMPVSSYDDLIKTLSPCVTTNIGTIELLNMAKNSYEILQKGDSIKQGEFPIIDEVHSKGGKYKKAGWVWRYDTNSVVVLKQFIFDDVDMENNKYLNETDKIKLNG